MFVSMANGSFIESDNSPPTNLRNSWAHNAVRQETTTAGNFLSGRFDTSRAAGTPDRHLAGYRMFASSHNLGTRSSISSPRPPTHRPSAGHSRGTSAEFPFGRSPTTTARKTTDNRFRRNRPLEQELSPLSSSGEEKLELL